MAIPGDSLEEEEEEDVEGVSSNGYRTPPDFMPAPDLSPLLSLEKLERGGRPDTLLSSSSMRVYTSRFTILLADTMI